MAGGADPTHVFKCRIKRWRRVCQLEKHIHFLQRTAGCHFVRGKRLSTTTWKPTTSRLWKCCHYACGNIICAACCCIVTMKSQAKTGPLFCWSSTKAHWSEANMHSLGARKNCRFDHHVWTVPRCDPRARRCLADAWKVILNVWSCRPRVGKGSSQEGEMEEHRSSTRVSFLFFLDQTTWTTCCLRTSEGKQSCPAAHGVTSFLVSIFKFGDQTNPLGESCSVNCTATSQLWEVNKLKNSLPSSVKVAHTALWTHLKGKLSLLRSFS